MPFSTETVQAGEYVLVRYQGMLNSSNLGRMHVAVKNLLKGHDWKRLLVDFRKVENRIGAAEIYHFVTTNWHELRGMRIALLCPPYLKDDGSFTETVASNRGLRLKSFAEDRVALDWLV